MRQFFFLAAFTGLIGLAKSDTWPYDRYPARKDAGFVGNLPNDPPPEFHSEPPDLFVDWLRSVVNRNDSLELQNVFKNGTIPDHVNSIDDLILHVKTPKEPTTPVLGPPIPIKAPAYDPQTEAARLFRHLNYPLDPRCLINKSSCETSEGSVGTARQRDYQQHTYADGISKPREGPNARAVSNAFFKRKKKIYYEHTPLLLGLIEFIMHDVTYSQDSTEESIQVTMPKDEEVFPLNTTLKVQRTAAVPGTGTSESNPRENINMASTWLDISSLYGSTSDVALRLRSKVDGKLLTQEVQTPGTKASASYLPFNTMNVSTNTRPGVKVEDLFAGGDPRTNEDWLLLGVHTLLLREHNRLCDILKKQKPDWDDEQLYQTVRLLMSAKYALIANSYQMAYWTDKMPWPRDDGFPLYRQMFGENALEINPANTYPWPLVTKNGKPMTVSAEMAVVYRFHEFIIPSFPIKNQNNETLWEQNLFDTGFNATGFLNVGLERVLAGTVASHIPNFKSGVDEHFRSAGKYRGHQFDIVVSSIVHEREQGLPTFNQYFREYNKQNPKVVVPIRDTWSKFSSDPEVVRDLERLYDHPDDVDLVVGCQLDEEWFPGTTVPKSALIISLFSLFGMGNSDRFSIGFSMMRCLLVDRPWDCHPSNALEDLLWEHKKVPGFPNFRFYNEFWLKELDLPAHGTNLLWRLITENSEINCVQRSPLFPHDNITNPLMCMKPTEQVGWLETIFQFLQIILSLLKQGPFKFVATIIITVLSGIMAIIHFLQSWPWGDAPPSLIGWPIIGQALSFQRNPLKVLRRGFKKYSHSVSRCFGIKLASLTHYVITNPRDLQLMMDDNTSERKFSLHEFLRAINFELITKKVNFKSDLHTQLIRSHFGNPSTLARFHPVIETASKDFLKRKPLTMGEPTRNANINNWIDEYITFVVSRCIVGPEGYDNPELITTFLKFNNDAIATMGLSSMLPGFLQFLASRTINKDFDAIRRVTLPIIKKRREMHGKTEEPVFMDFILEEVDDDNRVADLIAIIVWGGLVNLQATFSSTLLDIINEPDGQSKLLPTLQCANVAELDTFRSWEIESPWNSLRSAMFESIRLSGPITGPARIVLEKVPLASQPSIKLPSRSVATLSAYSTHRDTAAWGEDAATYRPARFIQKAPPVGQPEFITWGLEGPHMCPGRWFGQATIMVMTNSVLETYNFKPERRLSDEEKYVYTAGNVGRVPVGMEVELRAKN
ncbi:heme peroxidase [Fusarium venenatum]|uniref:heme peroxidase n=1 Tax=Fusarium venenatum TaxID=56646 RepID=UPI001DED9C54|nr:heme peroxidase [Fusarium venenatum]